MNNTVHIRNNTVHIRIVQIKIASRTNLPKLTKPSSGWRTRGAEAGSSRRREVVGTRGGVGTADAREAVAMIGVGRGGGGVLGVAGRVAWAQGERNR